MREIKFDIIWREKADKLIRHDRLTLEEIESAEPDYADYEVIARRQYTGLRDKNGREIYEGDVLHIDSGITVGIGDVRWRQGSFCVMTAASYTFWLHFLEEDAIVEVIGNIYDNPDLLASAS